MLVVPWVRKDPNLYQNKAENMVPTEFGPGGAGWWWYFTYTSSTCYTSSHTTHPAPSPSCLWELLFPDHAKIQDLPFSHHHAEAHFISVGSVGTGPLLRRRPVLLSTIRNPASHIQFFLRAWNHGFWVHFYKEEKQHFLRSSLYLSHVILLLFVLISYLNHIYPFSYIKKALFTINIIQQQNTICSSEVRLGNASESGRKHEGNSSNQSVSLVLPHSSSLLCSLFFSPRL